jgi:prolyl 4-hydroxylase
MPSLTSITLAALGGLAVIPGATASQQTVLKKPDNYVCEHPPYKPRLVSKSPLVIYLENFITPWERTYLLALG